MFGHRGGAKKTQRLSPVATSVSFASSPHLHAISHVSRPLAAPPAPPAPDAAQAAAAALPRRSQAPMWGFYVTAMAAVAVAVAFL